MHDGGKAPKSPMTGRSHGAFATVSLFLWCCLAAQAEQYTVPLFVAPAGGGDPQGVLRLVNDADTAATVAIHVVGDDGTVVGSATLTLNALAAVEIGAADLQSGNAAKGLPAGLGSFAGEVRLVIDSDVSIVPSAYVRGSDGTLTAMHDTVHVAVAADSYRYEVPIFHPASNITQPSRLRLINRADSTANITIRAIDDGGISASGGTVALTLPAGAARTVSAQQLEAGDAAAFSGQLGAGIGNWRLSVAADTPVEVLNFTVSSTGAWRNLSTTALTGWAPDSAASLAERLAQRTVVVRDGRDRVELQVLPAGRFRATLTESGVVVAAGGLYRYERVGRDVAQLLLEYDSGESCDSHLYFEAPLSGWHSSACLGSNLVESWSGGPWSVLATGAVHLDLGAGPSDQSYSVGSAIDALTLPAASGGDGQLTYSLSPDVPGLSFDPQTREVTGTPAEAGTWVLTYRVQDISGDTDRRYFTVAVEAPGGDETTLAVGDTAFDLPATGAWNLDGELSPGASFGTQADGSLTIQLNEGAYIEEGDFRYTCQSSGGCRIDNRQASAEARVSSGTVVRTQKVAAPGGGTAPPVGGGTDSGMAGGFELLAGHSNSRGIAYANDRFYFLQWIRNRVVAYTPTGQHDPENDFDVVDLNLGPLHRLAYANGRFYIFQVHGVGGKLFAYSTEGQRDASNDLELPDRPYWPRGVAFAGGRYYVVRLRTGTVDAFTASGERDAAADFDLGLDNRGPAGIVYADGRFYVVDGQEEKVFAYTASGARDTAADVTLACDNVDPIGIAHARGGFHVLNWEDRKVFAYAGDGQNTDSSLCFRGGSSPGRTRYTVGTPISTLTLASARGGDGPLTYSLAPAVPGLSFDATTGLLTGTPSAAGTYEMTYTVRDTAGNTASLTFAITVVSEPDLVVESVSVSDNSPSGGASFTLNATVRNRGAARSEPTTLRYYRSSNASITGSDTAVGTDSVGALAPSGTSAQSVTLTAPSNADTYYYGACVETVSEESNSGNNCSSAARVSVGGGTDPQPDAYTPLRGMRVSPGRIQFVFFSSSRCIDINDSSVGGVIYSVHTSMWQRRAGSNSAWEDVPGTQQQGKLCALNPTSAGEYRLVADMTIGGSRGSYSSENTFVIE